MTEYLAVFRLVGQWAVLATLMAGSGLHGITILQTMQEGRDDILDRELVQIQADGFS